MLVFWQECCAELKVYAVLRTKGGSGERHTVRVLQQQLIQSGERPLIVRVFKVRDNEYGTDFDSLAELENTDKLDWYVYRRLERVPLQLSIGSGSTQIIIYERNFNSRGELWSRL